MKPDELHAKQERSNLERLESMSLEEIVNSVIPDLPGDYKTAACRLASDAISYEREIERLRGALEEIANLPEAVKTDVYPRALARRALDGDE